MLYDQFFVFPESNDVMLHILPWQLPSVASGNELWPGVESSPKMTNIAFISVWLCFKQEQANTGSREGRDCWMTGKLESLSQGAGPLAGVHGMF
ncbi:hypothetical protein C4A30_03639 [Escherichia coli]|nr:hypothetical protein C4A51_02688 [Escherichia coli]RDP82595.1 hypothetical protein C4A46_03467 [Escherichia coli]RDP95975.1 hypothetical protein C4A41_03457 [Escherichia coli]RDQ29320.1 hypothetical protein C4A34_03472 [Escherichia coli]RDQ42189.1 hypothetical protein C4A32_03453 [Escherichia coli]